MAQNFVTSSIVAKETLMHLENDLVIANKVHVDYSKEFTDVGETISIRRPVRFLGQEDNLDITGVREDIKSGTVPITMDSTITVPFEIAPKDRTLKVTDDRFQERYIKPAVIRMKDSIERKLGLLYKRFYHHSGAPGTVPSTFLELGDGRTILSNAAAPSSDRCAFHNPDTALQLANGLRTTYVETKARTAFEEAKIGRYASFDNMETVHVPTHTVGALGGTPVVNGGTQNVTYEASMDTRKQDLVTDGWSNSVTDVLKEGDVFTIAGVKAVNPISKESTGRLQDFVVRADVDSDGSGNSTISISPPIITSGAYQTVAIDGGLTAPADDAAITVKSGTADTSYKQSILMHKNAMSLVTRPLAISDAGLKTYTVQGNRMSISVTESGDFNTLKHMFRLDCLFGLDVNYDDLGVRLVGGSV